MNTTYLLFLILTILTAVYCRMSWYYPGDPNSKYHPPYDLNPLTGAPWNTTLCASTFTCPNGQVPIQNPNYVINVAGACEIPGWLSSGNTYAVNHFDSCCSSYSRCLQTCGVAKSFCDNQFYGCTWATCYANQILRPGDRIYCHAISTCYSSYLARTATCGNFNTYQAQACSCGTAVASPSSSPAVANSLAPSSTLTTTAIPSASPSTAIVGKRQNGTPTATFTAGPSSASATFSAGSASNSPVPVYDNSGSLYSNGWGSYIVRSVPDWDLFQNRCPPSFYNYVNVMTDQEMDDVNYWGGSQNSAGSISSWMSWL